MATYYRQRASAGLIVSEGIAPEPRGRGFMFTPCLGSEPQAGAWRPITDAVRARGGRMFAQLMHVGRVTHAAIMPGGASPVSASAVAPSPEFRGYAFNAPSPKQAFETPEQLDATGISRTIDAYVDAARRAFTAGFAGVEVHGGSGYLPMQFLCSGTNTRTDAYGGSCQRRTRFVEELIEALCAVDGPERVSIKLSPGFRFNDAHDEDPEQLYRHLFSRLRGRSLAYVQISQYGDYYGYDSPTDWLTAARTEYDGRLVANGGLTGASAAKLISSGTVDAVAFGASFIANPDLPERLAQDAPLNVPDATTFYTQGARGYTDYPTRAESTATDRAGSYDVSDVNRVVAADGSR